MQQPADPNQLIIGDSASVLARFNEEKVWVEFFLTRSLPAQMRARSMMRVRFMKNASFDGRWHALKANENFEITLEK